MTVGGASAPSPSTASRPYWAHPLPAYWYRAGSAPVPPGRPAQRDRRQLHSVLTRHGGEPAVDQAAARVAAPNRAHWPSCRPEHSDNLPPQPPVSQRQRLRNRLREPGDLQPAAAVRWVQRFIVECQPSIEDLRTAVFAFDRRRSEPAVLEPLLLKLTGRWRP